MTLTLSSCLRKQSLISVRRRNIDDYEIQGFLVGLSENLMALEYVHDFQVDGLMVLRRADITDERRTGTDEFQEKLLRDEGVRSGTQIQSPLKLDEWRSALEHLAETHEYMILERELGPAPEFAIGRPVRITAAQIEFQAFSGTARWYPKTERFKYSQLTSVRINTRYLGFYQRHFARGVA